MACGATGLGSIPGESTKALICYGVFFVSQFFYVLLWINVLDGMFWYVTLDVYELQSIIINYVHQECRLN